MAIRRCPYCKAIIDEQDKYCNNCGTQLLFPEDEFIEEEIPGDRIVDEDETHGEEHAEQELKETVAGEEKTEKDEEEAEEREEEVEDEEAEEDEEEEEDSGELEEAEEEDEEEEEELEPEPDEDELEEEREIEQPSGEIGAEETVAKADRVDEPDKKYEVSIEEDELVFKAKELDNLDETPHEVPALFQEGEEPATTPKEELPPWASGMKETTPHSAEPGREEELETKAEIEEEKPPTRPDWTTDSGIGIPEKVTQAALPFTTAALPATAVEKDTMVGEEEYEEPVSETRRRAGFSLRLKSKLVDLVFITALWLISLWFTAQVIGVSFFRIFVASPVPILIFYFILLLLYFFLFLFFLGETLGDHYFSEEE